MNEDSEIEQFAPWVVLIITLTGGLLRVFILANKGMWLDETFSVWLANHSVGDMLQWIVRIDQHPPLYYLLLHYWVALNGDTPYQVRLLSALFGTATIPVVYLIGKRMSGVVMGFVAALLLALSLFNIYFAQETRMYTLLTFQSRPWRFMPWSGCSPIREPSGPSAASFGNICTPGVRSGRLNQTPKKSLAIKMKLASKPGWEPGFPIIVGHPSGPLRLTWPGLSLIVFSAATMLSHNTAVLFPVATNIFVLGLMLIQRNKETGISALLPGALFVELGEGSDWHLPAHGVHG